MSQPSILRTISRNAASSWAALVVQVVVVFFMTPYIVSSLGPVRYGVWALVTGLTGYYGLLDLGIRAGMTQYFTRYLATGNYEKLNSTASTGFVAMASCGCLLAGLTICIGWMAPIILRLPADLVWETRWCITSIGMSVSISFALQSFAALFPAMQRFEVVNGVVICTLLISAGSTVAALWLGYGLVVLSLISAGVNLLLYCVLWRLAYFMLPKLDVSLKLANREDLLPIVRYGGWSFLINAATVLRTRADVLIVGVFLPIGAVAPYALALSMAEYFDRVFAPIGYILFPAMTDLDARGDVSRLKMAYLSGTKMVMLMAIAIGTISAACATDFFRLWITVDVTSDGAYPTPAALYCILVAAAVSTASQHVGNTICMGTRRMRSLAAIAMSETAFKVGLSLILAPRFGLMGIAMGTAVPAVVFQLALLPAIVLRILDIKARDYVNTTCLRPLLAGVAIAGLSVPLMQHAPVISNWLHLFIFAMLFAIVVCIPLLLIGLTGAERRRLLLYPLLSTVRRTWQSPRL